MGKYSGFVSAVVLALLALAPSVGESEPLTRQQLLDMKSAGIGEKVIIQQVETNGIGFEANPNALIALRKAGFSDALLGVVTKAPNSGKQSAALSSMSTSTSATPPAVSSSSSTEQQARACTPLYAKVEVIETSCKRVARGRRFLVEIDQQHLNDDRDRYADHCNRFNACGVLKTVEDMAKNRQCIDDGAYLEASCTQDLYDPRQVRYTNIQVLQANDNNLSCTDLKVESNSLEEDVAELAQTEQRFAGQAQAHSQNARTETAMASAAPRLAPSLTMMGSAEQNQSTSDTQRAGNVQQLRDNYQKRHDYLMQMYFTKRCHE